MRASASLLVPQLNDKKIYDIQSAKSLQSTDDQAAFAKMMAACKTLNGTIESSVPVTQSLGS